MTVGSMLSDTHNSRRRSLSFDFGILKCSTADPAAETKKTASKTKDNVFLLAIFVHKQIVGFDSY